MRVKDEQNVLKLSIVTTFLVAVFGVVMGVLTGASSIVFDGMYSVLDCLFSIAALAVARLLQIDAERYRKKAPQFTERFQHGFWHLEPLLLAINGLCLSIAVVYGLFGAAGSIWRGGHSASFGWGVVYAFIAAIACFGLAFYETLRNRTIKSAFIKIDVRGWVISGGISLAVFIAFIGAYFLDGSPYAWFAPYIDPITLLIICLIMAPMPLKTVWRAMQDVFMITPVALDARVIEVVEAVVEKYGFVDFESYVARVGRSLMIEIHLILPEHYPINTIEWLDKVRGEIGEGIGHAGPDRWLTVSFTGKTEWAR